MNIWSEIGPPYPFVIIQSNCQDNHLTNEVDVPAGTNWTNIIHMKVVNFLVQWTINNALKPIYEYLDSLAQNCRISIANVLEPLRFALSHRYVPESGLSPPIWYQYLNQFSQLNCCCPCDAQQIISMSVRLYMKAYSFLDNCNLYLWICHWQSIIL